MSVLTEQGGILLQHIPTIDNDEDFDLNEYNCLMSNQYFHMHLRGAVR